MGISYWHDSVLDPEVRRAPLPGDLDVDVAIVGGGFTGLWTARSLLVADPAIRVAVLEGSTVGFGASGRNGGWCVGDYGGPEGSVARAGGSSAVEAMAREMHRSVDDVEAVVRAGGIDCGFHRGGALYVAANAGQLRRSRAHHRTFVRHGLSDAWRWLDAEEIGRHVRLDGALGGLHTPHAAAVHPARLARALAAEVEALGGTIHEQTRVTSVEHGTARTERGTVRAEVVVLATEAYTGTIDGQRRRMLPLSNDVIATDPIDAATWEEIGLADRELFELGAILLGYGQRTADGRIVWGGLAAGSRWNGGIPDPGAATARLRDRLLRTLVELFPVLDGIGVSHHWSGVLGVPRDLLPGIGVDRAAGIAWAGGYTGQGVAAANSAGRGLADLIRGVDSDLVHLPWVDHRARRWEPEPLPWLGVHAVTAAAHVADRFDRWRGGRQSRSSR